MHVDSAGVVRIYCGWEVNSGEVYNGFGIRIRQERHDWGGNCATGFHRTLLVSAVIRATPSGETIVVGIRWVGGQLWFLGRG